MEYTRHYDYYVIIEKVLNIRIEQTGTGCVAYAYDGGHQVCKIDSAGTKEEVYSNMVGWVEDNYKVIDEPH